MGSRYAPSRQSNLDKVRQASKWAIIVLLLLAILYPAATNLTYKGHKSGRGVLHPERFNQKQAMDHHRAKLQLDVPGTIHQHDRLIQPDGQLIQRNEEKRWICRHCPTGDESLDCCWPWGHIPTVEYPGPRPGYEDDRLRARTQVPADKDHEKRFTCRHCGNDDLYSDCCLRAWNGNLIPNIDYPGSPSDYPSGKPEDRAIPWPRLQVRTGLWPDDWNPENEADCDKVKDRGEEVFQKCIRHVRNQNLGLAIIGGILITSAACALSFGLLTCIKRARESRRPALGEKRIQSTEIPKKRFIWTRQTTGQTVVEQKPIPEYPKRIQQAGRDGFVVSSMDGTGESRTRRLEEKQHIPVSHCNHCSSNYIVIYSSGHFRRLLKPGHLAFLPCNFQSLRLQLFEGIVVLGLVPRLGTLRQESRILNLNGAL